MEHLLPSGSDPDPFGGSTVPDGSVIPDGAGFPDGATLPDGSVFPDVSGGGGFGGGFDTLTAVVLTVMALVGAVVLVSGIAQVVRARRRSAEVRSWGERGRTTTGTVVDNRMQSLRHTEGIAGQEWRTRSSLSFSPVVRFEADGREVTVAGDQVSHRSFLTGRPAQVVYDPADPERAHVVAEGGSAFGGRATGALLIGSGVLLLLVLAVVARMASSVL